jgi:hypothetical protein
LRQQRQAGIPHAPQAARRASRDPLWPFRSAIGLIGRVHDLETHVASLLTGRAAAPPADGKIIQIMRAALVIGGVA